jgi:hypothetical protein
MVQMRDIWSRGNGGHLPVRNRQEALDAAVTRAT